MRVAPSKDEPLLDPLLDVENQDVDSEEDIGSQLGAAVIVAGLNYTVTLGRKLLRRAVRKTVLENVSVTIEAGALTAVMGPSGSGKTSLLECVGRVSRNRKVPSGQTLTGRIVLDASTGVVLVPQDDVLLSGLTARELMGYVAELRGVDTSRVDQVLELLGLADCADSQVGSPDKRGLSGGQRKRVSIGLELLTNPGCILLDEPTSGLDSKMALDVVSILNSLANDQGKTVITTLHQPSVRIYRLIDAFVLMVKGRVAFAGRDPGLYFGTRMVKDENPAEQFLEWLQEDDASVEAMVSAWAAKQPRLDDAAIDRLAESHFAAARARSRSASAATYTTKTHFRGCRRFVRKLRLRAQHTRILVRRELLDRCKDPDKFVQNLTVKACVGLIIGLVWINQASHKQDGIFPVQGALFIVCVNSVMDATFTTSMGVPTSRTLLLRELGNGYYTLLSRHVAVTLVDWLLASCTSLVLSVPVYMLVGLRRDPFRFARFVACACCLAFSGASFGHLVGTVSNSFKEVQQYVSPSLTPLILFSGYMIPKRQIPYAFKWLYDVSFFSHALRVFEVNQFRGWKFHDCDGAVVADDGFYDKYFNITGVDFPSTSCYTDGGAFLRSQGIDPKLLPRDFAILACYFLVLGCLAFFAYARIIARH